MSGIFLTMNTAKRGLFAQQQAVSTAGHNIANANTDGYSRQRVELVTTPGYRIPNVGMVGTGVDISTIARVRDSYLDVQIRYETSIAGQYKARQDILEQIETAFLEPGENGLNTYMGKMWDAWQDLSNSPENSNTRTIVRDNSLTFTDSLNHLYQQLDTLKADSISLEESKVLDAHSILDQIKDLNNQIFKIKISGDEPNDLLDKRDLLLDELSEIIDFTATEDEHGRVTITHMNGADEVTLLGTDKGKEIQYEMSVVRSVEKDADGNVVKVTLVRGGDSINGVVELPAGSYPSYMQEGAVVLNNMSWEKGSTDLTSADLKSFEITNGELKGYQTVSEETAKYQDQLNGLARAIAYAVNKVHSYDGKYPTVTDAFFVGDNGTEQGVVALADINAGNITVSKTIINDVNKIHAKKEIDGPAGDGERALAIAQLRNTRLPVQDFMDKDFLVNPSKKITYNMEEMKFTNADSGNTFEGYFKDIIVGLGISAKDADKMVENQDALTGQLIQRRYSISGVSMDEEITNLIQFQHAYQANANVISTLTVMLDTLINRMGV